MKGLLISVVPATTVSGQPYTVLTLINEEEQSVVNVWNTTPKDFSLFKYYSLTNVKSNDKGNSCVLSSCTSSNEIPQSLLKFIPKVPTYEDFMHLCKSLALFMNDSYSTVFLHLVNDVYKKYSEAPAAKKNHHAYPGGLLQHTYELLKMFLSLRGSLPFQVDDFVVATACLLHDYGKLYEYKDGDYTDFLFLQGHVHYSAYYAKDLIDRISSHGITSSIVNNVVHCILAHHGKPEYGSLVPATPEAFLVNKLDELSGIGFQYTIPGRSYSLNTKVIHL